LIGAAGVDGVADLGVVDALEVDRADVGSVCPSRRWMTIGGTPSRAEPDGVGVAQLVRCEAPPRGGCGDDPAELRAGRGG